MAKILTPERLNRFEKNDTIDIDIDDLGMDGEGVAHADGVTFFIRGALPAERVRAKIILVKKTFCIAIIEKILRESADRVTPPCAVFGKCGGCTLQHLSYAAQLSFKQKRVADTLKKVGGIEARVEPVVKSSKQYFYRNKLSFPVQGTPPKVGFFAAGTHRLVSVSACDIQFEGHEKLLAIFERFLQENNLTGYDEMTGEGDVKHLVARRIGGTTYATIVTPKAAMPQIKAFNTMLAAEYGNAYALYLNFNPVKNNVIWGEKTEFVGGKKDSVNIDGLKVNVHPKSFFQVNDFIRASIYADVKKELEGSEKVTVLEAYSGSGFMTALLAQAAEKVIAVERESAAVDSAKLLMRENNIHNTELVCGDCGKEIPRLAKTLAGKNLAVVLDPPRAGCDDAVITAVAESGAKKVVYVSCNPATLARDTAKLIAAGYVVERITPYDMFPNTAEVETVLVLKKP